MVPSSTFEVFSTDCPLCRETLKHLQGAITKRGCGCSVTVHRCSGDECCEPGKRYRVSAMPTIVRDGQIIHSSALRSQKEAEALLP